MLNLELYKRGFLPAGRARERLPTIGHAGVIELSADDLPAVCPHASMPLWAWHPRVFLDVVNQNEAMCRYCGTRYHLPREVRVHDHEFGARCLHQHRRHDTRRADPRSGTAVAPGRESASPVVSGDCSQPGEALNKSVRAELEPVLSDNRREA